MTEHVAIYGTLDYDLGIVDVINNATLLCHGCQFSLEEEIR